MHLLIIYKSEKMMSKESINLMHGTKKKKKKNYGKKWLSFHLEFLIRFPESLDIKFTFLDVIEYNANLLSKCIGFCFTLDTIDIYA